MIELNFSLVLNMNLDEVFQETLKPRIFGITLPLRILPVIRIKIASEARDRVAKYLTLNQLRECQKIASEWKPKE